jgi:phosphatidylserine/phosphatidylglycerophosphate/cardiolipin synthase-like enzyme
MWRECVPAVSSALLFLSIVLAPHHVGFVVTTEGEAANSGTQLLITEFYPCALSNDEYFVISSACTYRVNLANCSISDGEGTLTFVGDFWLLPCGSLSVSMNSTSFLRAFGRSPDITVGDPSGRLLRTGTFRLADAGDSLALASSAGTQIDFVKYGSSVEPSSIWLGEPMPSLRQGEVARRVHSNTGWQDSDSAGDWAPFREYRYGYTEFDPFQVSVPAGDLTAFTSPDCSLDVVLDVLRGSQRTVRLCTYELSSAAVCHELLAASARGVDVRILVDGAPAGGMSPSQVDCLSVLTAASIDVATVNGNLSKKVVQHFGPLHSKYAVIDSSKSLILSENFVESGVPEDRLTANRGWGLCITSPEAGRYLSSIFDSDARSSRPDVIPWRFDTRCSSSAVLPDVPRSNHSYGALAPMRTTTDARVEFVPSPDASELSPFLCPLLRDSKSMIVEQFQVDLYWQGRWSSSPAVSPLLDAMIGAMRDGFVVRMIFDSSWFNADGNGPALRFLSGISDNSSLQGEFKLMDPKNPITVVHNKGAVFEGRTTLVSSNNWGFSSFAKNRELAAIIESEEIAGYFTRAFDMDWTPDVTPPRAEAGENLTVHLGQVVELNGSRSLDDRGIAHYGWDIDGDGQFEALTPSTSFVPDHAGRFEVRLTVEDGWGNKDVDIVIVQVLRPGAVGGSGSTTWPMHHLVGIVAAGLGAVLGVKLAKKRLHRPRVL